jgi:hypothetical protein
MLTTLILLFYIDRYNYFQQQAEDYEMMAGVVKKVIYKEMVECDNKETFLKYC